METIANIFKAALEKNKIAKQIKATQRRIGTSKLYDPWAYPQQAK